jgi:hypothetical protein
MYEINLVKSKCDPANTDYDFDYFMTYNWPEIPQIGDKIHIKENEVFEVKGRLLPSSEISDRVVLFGVTAFLFKQAKYTAKL